MAYIITLATDINEQFLFFRNTISTPLYIQQPYCKLLNSENELGSFVRMTK